MIPYSNSIEQSGAICQAPMLDGRKPAHRMIRMMARSTTRKVRIVRIWS